jgi:hypothetical protein
MAILEEVDDAAPNYYQVGSVLTGLGVSVADPGCLSRIPDPDFYPTRIPDSGSRIPDLGSRISDPGFRILDLGSRIQNQ